MAYAYEFDNTNLGDWTFARTAYQEIAAGLSVLLGRVRELNDLAVQLGAIEAPYLQESRRLEKMIEVAETDLADERKDRISVKGISVGSMRFLRAAVELAARLRREELREHRRAGLPSGVLRSIEAPLKELEGLAQKLPVEPADLLWEVLPQEEAADIAQQIRAEEADQLWDCFVSHAWEDKEGFVRPLVEALGRQGVKVWYDEFTLRVGDSLRRAIDRGLSRSRYGIVVLSPRFLAKEWPQRELDGLLALESDGQKIILPVWHDITADAIRAYSPTLADRVAVRSSVGLERVTAQLMQVLRPQ